jgi:hypothetical protein
MKVIDTFMPGSMLTNRLREKFVAEPISNTGSAQEPQEPQDDESDIIIVHEVQELSPCMETILNIVSVLIGLVCIYISWTCNTKEGVNIFAKIVYSFFAFMFGIFYLLYYFLVRQYFCNPFDDKTLDSIFMAKQ